MSKFVKMRSGHLNYLLYILYFQDHGSRVRPSTMLLHFGHHLICKKYTFCFLAKKKYSCRIMNDGQAQYIFSFSLCKITNTNTHSFTRTACHFTNSRVSYNNSSLASTLWKKMTGRYLKLGSGLIPKVGKVF